jgi:cytochrome c-type biogenesis protein
MNAASCVLAFVAGLLSLLSPCVLPMLPIVLGAAAGTHRMGPLALAGGLILSFVGIGLFVATLGFAIGLDGDVFRTAGAVLMIIVGLFVAVPVLQSSFAAAGFPAFHWAGQKLAGFSARGVGGQFGLGLLLGAVWSPCVGPTLGAASLLAAQGRSLGSVTAVMASFGLGASLPLVAVGRLSRSALPRWRRTAIAAGAGARMALGGMLVGFGMMIVTGFDRSLETALVNASPQWLTDLTTRF